MRDRRRVLAVTSSRKRLDQLKNWLAAAQIKVDGVTGCKQAREYCREAERHPCLVITDLSLRDGNWYTVLKHMVDCGLCSELAVAGAGDRPSGRMLAYGVDTVLQEPLQKEEILAAVRRAIKRSNPALNTRQRKARRVAAGGGDAAPPGKRLYSLP